MRANISITLILLLIMMALFVGSIFLQIILSKKKNKFLGLILPIITFLMVSIITLGMYSFDNVKQKTSLTDSEGEVISEVVEYNDNGKNFNFSIIVITIFFNIPTFIYLGIYLSYSKHRKQLTSVSQDELIKMNIQDLE